MPPKSDTPEIIRETRAFHTQEVRAEGDSGLRVSGYAAVFNEVTTIGDYFEEVIAPGAFTETLKVRGIKGAAQDVVFLFNHNDSLILARTRSGTLIVREDSHGLYMESVLDAVDPDAVRVVSKMKRGDLDKMSFAFRAFEQVWEEAPERLPKRTVTRAELFDVSVVTDPAYTGTDIGLRSLTDHRAAQNLPPQVNNAAALSRLRMKSALLRRLS